MSFDPLLLSRIQFAWVIAWHILLPAFTVGLASYIAVLEGLHLRRDARSISASRPSGSGFSPSRSAWASCPASSCPFSSARTGAASPTPTANVISPLLAYEGLTAFFLEAAFLGVLLFGRKLVPRWAHFFAALMVALGTLSSTFWILATNSWMQTPAGYDDGRRPLHAERLDRDHLQPVLPLSPGAHGRRRSTSPPASSCCGVARLLSAARALRRGGADDAVDGALVC